MDPQLKVPREALDSWKRTFSTDLIQSSPEAFDPDKIDTLYWKDVFPPSIRVINIMRLADVLQMASARQEDPTGLVEADLAESDAYENASCDISYLTKMYQIINMYKPPDFQGASPSASAGAPPRYYFFTQPISEDFLVLRIFHVAGVEIQDLSDCRKRVRPRRSDDPRGPFHDLTRRHAEISKTGENLLARLLSKADMPHCMRRISATDPSKIVITPIPPLVKTANSLSTISLHSACNALTFGLQTVNKELENLLRYPGRDLQIKYIEEMYASSIMLILKSFTKQLKDVDIAKLKYRTEFMGIRGPQLLEKMKEEHGMQRRNDLEEYYKNAFGVKREEKHSTKTNNQKIEQLQHQVRTWVISDSVLPEHMPQQEEGSDGNQADSLDGVDAFISSLGGI